MRSLYVYLMKDATDRVRDVALRHAPMRPRQQLRPAGLRKKLPRQAAAETVSAVF